MKRRWLKRVLLALAALLVLLVLVVAWLGGTGGGLRFALNRTVIALDGKLTYARAEGSLFGGLRLFDVRYADPAVGDYRAAVLTIAPRSRHLLSGELYLTGLSLSEVRVRLPPPQNEASSNEPFALPVVLAPIALRIDRLRIDDIDVRQHDDVPVLMLDGIEAAAHWRDAEFAVQSLRIEAAQGALAGQLAFDTAVDWTGAAVIEGHWQLPDRPQPIAGRVHLQGPQRQPSLELRLNQPGPAVLELRWEDVAGVAQWRLRTHSEGLDLADLGIAAPVRRLAFELDGSGSGQRAELSGTLAIDGYPLSLERLAGSWRERQLHIDALALAEHNGPGRLQGNARIDLNATTPTGELALTWQALSPPLSAPFDRLAASGRIQASGTLAELVAHIEAEATVDGRPLRLNAHVQGDPQGELKLAPLSLATGDGRLDVTGHVRVQPALSWAVHLHARDFDPGLLLPDWPGRIAMDADSHGRQDADTLTASLDIASLGGSLRQRPVRGSGRVNFTGLDRIDADLALALGENTLNVVGRLGDEYDAQVRFRFDEPAVLYSGAAGQANGELRISGRWPALAVVGRIEGQQLAFDDLRAGSLSLAVDARTDFSSDGQVELTASNGVLAGQRFDQLALQARGDADSNRLDLDVSSTRGRLELSVAGRYDRTDQAWTGQLQALQWAGVDLPEALSLRAPASLSLARERVVLAEACWQTSASSVCLDGDWQRDSGGRFGFDVSRLPLAWLLTLAGEDTLVADGELSARGRFRIDTAGSLAGVAQAEGPPGRIRLLAGERDLAAWTRLDGTLDLDGPRRTFEASIDLSPRGSVRANVTSVAAAQGADSLDGRIDVSLPDLSFIELLAPDIVQPVGELRGQLTLAGNTDAPSLTGDIALAGFRAELPALGLRLRDSTLALRARSGNRIEVEGRIATEQNSTLLLDGWFGLPVAGRVPMALRITGNEVLVADIPAARVRITPDLTVTATSERLVVRGEVAVPQARLAPEQIEGGATAVSPDVVIVDAPEPAAATAGGGGLPLYADVDVKLGERVSIDGYGLKGRLRGELRVRERPGRATRGRGEIVVTGTYQAYGQDLDIERGRLLFNNSALDNPTLDIRAIRKVSTVTAGLVVTGTATRPVLEVYSQPAMDQAEALSYLVLGRPLRAATSAEDQDLLGTAAAAVTTAGGDLLAKSLGARLGLDEVGVGSSRELGAGALTVGKYLSPRLYIGYGRSLFDGGQLVNLRYRLTERLELEAQSGTRDNKAGINYRYER